MFRSLRTRLIAAYVFAAIVLVVVAAVGVTAFALSMFGISVRESVESAARTAPDEARLELARFHGSLAAAAPDIIRHLVRPGLHVSVLAVDREGRRKLLARGNADKPDVPVQVSVGENFPGPQAPNRVVIFRGDSGLPRPGSTIAKPLFPRPPPPFPLGLNAFLHIEGKLVHIPGGLISIFPFPSQLDRFVRAFWIAMIPIGFIVVVGAWFGGRLIANQALRPLVETTASLNRFAGGDFTPRPIVTTDRSEIGALVTAYNGAAAQVSAAFEERRKVETQMRQFVADAGHELRTPLTVVMGFIDILRRRATAENPASARIFETMLHESRRMRALIDKLISLARLENPERRAIGPVEVADVAEHVVDALEALQTQPRIALHAEHGLVVEADEYELHEAVSNLVDNALKYAPASPIDVTVRSEGADVLVEVIDRGPGLSDAEKARIFDRFYRGENRGDVEGSGLGLAIAKRAVERAGGELSVESSPDQGARFVIRLPRRTRAGADKETIAV